MEVNYRKIGERIQKIRKLRNLSVNDLAEKIRFTPKSVVLAEYGQTKLSVDFLMPLCTALNVTPNELLEGEYTVTSSETVERDLLLDEVNELLKTLKGEQEGRNASTGTVIKETEEAIEDIRRMVDKMRAENKERPKGTSGPIGYSRFSHRY